MKKIIQKVHGTFHPPIDSRGWVGGGGGGGRVIVLVLVLCGDCATNSNFVTVK